MNRWLARAIAALALVPALAIAQGYPGKPIKMIVPLAAASAVDTAARIVAQKMSTNMGQPVVIINRPGAGGGLGRSHALRAMGDRSTLHEWGHGCGTCPACELRAGGWQRWRSGAASA